MVVEKELNFYYSLSFNKFFLPSITVEILCICRFLTWHLLIDYSV